MRKTRKQRSSPIVCTAVGGMEARVKEKQGKDKNTNTDLLPFVFAPQMKMQAFSLEAWCKI